LDRDNLPVPSLQEQDPEPFFKGPNVKKVKTDERISWGYLNRIDRYFFLRVNIKLKLGRRMEGTKMIVDDKASAYNTGLLSPESGESAKKNKPPKEVAKKIPFKITVERTHTKVTKYLHVKNPPRAPPGNKNLVGPILKNFIKPIVPMIIELR